MEQAELIRTIAVLGLEIRWSVVEMIGFHGATGHLGGACSCADLLAALYGHQMRYRTDNPQWADRDRLILSKGHAAIAQYAALANCGMISRDELLTFKHLGSRLQGHPDRVKLPFVEAGTGSLGQGLSIANGIALALCLDGNRESRVYCLMGDGEMSEGQIWEAAATTAQFRLNQVIGIVDCNGLQATGSVSPLNRMEGLETRWRSVGWTCLSIDGHDISAILLALERASQCGESPTVILAKTVKGKGVSFAEGNPACHNTALTEDQYDVALADLDRLIAGWEGRTL